jgi:surfactin family lipopeptide synthetase A
MRYSNLIEILRKKKHLGGIGITFIEGSKQEYFLSYQELYHSALKGLSFLQSKGIQPKDELVFQIDDNKSFIIVFWACILGGIIPVPLSCGHNEDSKQKLFNIWPILSNPYLIISQKNVTRLNSFAKQKGFEDAFSEMGNNIIEEAGIASSRQEGNIFDVKENDIAFVQFSSGSTGNPKGIVLTHKNLISNLEAISEASIYSADDSMISWMPLTHDMGLIGFHMNPLVCGMNQYLIPTNLFIRRPLLWLDKASEHKVSILCSPNFGYRYFSKHFCIADTHKWELSHVRIIYNGAEPISQKLCWDFLNSLAKYGLKSRSMCPVYGLAEASLAVSISGLHDEVISMDLDRNKLNIGEEVLKACGNDSVSFVNVGKSVNYCSIRITDNENFALQDETLGHVQIKGDNVTSGYYNNDDHTNTVIKDGWLKTGDLGFISDGSLYITGRAKDIIFINGQNYYPHDIERIAEEIDAIELNKIIVVGYFNHQTEKEEVIAFILHRANIEKFIPIAKSLRMLVNIKMGLEIDRIIPVKDIPRTTSGKLQRFKLLEQYKTGNFREIELELKRVIDESGADTNFAPRPENEAEQKVLEIWRKILKCNTVSVTDNFFEIGGNSLKAAEMEMMLLKEFQVELTLEMLYEKQTIRELVEVIKSLRKQKYIPIPVIHEDIYSVSSSQKRLYYLWELDKTSIAYNIPVAFRIVGEINFKRLEDSIKRLISRHDSLRMSFHMTSEPKFKVHDHVAFALNCINYGPSELNDKLQYLVKPFDLVKEPLFRICLLKLNNNEHTLFLDFHHIISDGISLYNFVEELFKLYSAKELQELPVQFKDYPHWERNVLLSEKIEGQEAYWLKELEGELPTLEMPLDFPRPVIFNHEGEKIEFGLKKEITEQLKNIAKANKCTRHALMFTLFNILLSKYTGQEDIIVGIPVAGRRHPDLQHVHGMFVNNLAIRSIIKGNESFTEFLTTEKNRIKEALNNQDYPFEELVQRVSGKRNISRNPVFDSMFIYQSIGVPKIENGEVTLYQHFFDPGFSKFDISMEIFDDDDSIKYNIEYSTRLFKKETITRLAAHFDNLIKRVINNPNSKLSDLHILYDSEYNEYIHNFNNTEYTYPKNTTIHQLFEEQAKRSPANIAVEYDDKGITYQQLNNKANHLAMVLREKGVVPNGIVGILIRRSPELIISILGVLKAGGSYLGIDTDLPGERINLLISNSQCRLVIAGAQSVSNLKLNYSPKAEIINIDDLDLPDFESSNVKNINSTNDLAYLIYSSGTTGEPKGIMIEHRSLVNYISWAAANYINDEKTTFPLYTSISFDLTVTSIFTPLITGNKIVIYNEEGNDLVIEKILADNKVDIVKLTPSHFRVLRVSKLLKSTYQSKIKKFIVGGEQLESRLANDMYQKFQSNVEIFNEYGPTEATVGCMIYKFSPEEPQSSVPIGIPISNTQIYILDKFLNPTPIGVSGEIYISGEGMARGYLNNVEMTRQKFIPNPFIEGRQMYKTGDFAKRLNNGTIEYIGRSDQQVKINGYRIELSEIESHLMSHRNIDEALVVVSKKNRGNLLAYFKSYDFIEAVLLKSYLANRLPHYMIPVDFIRLEKIPLTKNGKVDYNALPDPEAHVETKVNLLPKNEIEQLCLKIWEDVLGENNLSTTDNFFKLGGDSIKAVQIASSLLDKGISLNAKDILTYQTINQTSLRAEIVGADIKYEQGIMEGDIQLTPIEWWFFSQNFENPNYYNQSILLKLNKKVNIPLLEETFRKVVEHHNSLRVNYNPEKKVLFYNLKHLDKKFVVEQFETGVTNDSFSELSEICQLVQGSFDITKSLLLKAAIIKENISSEMLFITAHHLIIDGVSWRVLLEDLHTIYNALEKVEAIKLPRKTATLIDWERKLYEYSRSEGLKIQGDYWNEIERFVFAIPQDFETNDWKVRNLNKLLGTLNKEKSNFLIKDAHQTYKTDVPILLNTALALALKEWTTLDIFVIEQENHGRHLDDIDTSRTLGWFTAMYPLKLKLKDDSIGNQIKAIKEQIKKVPGYGIGYGIFKYYEKRHSSISNDLSEIRLNYLGQFDRELNNEFFTYSTRSTGSDVEPNNLMTTKLELNSMIINGELRLEINYNKEAHKESTIKWFRDVFFNNLEQILRHIENEDDIHFTPSDFDSVSLNQEELDALF